MPARPLPEQWDEPIAVWREQLKADGFAEGTVRDRIRAIRRAAQAFAGCPWELTAERLEDYARQQSWNDLTRGTWLRTVRLFYEFAMRKGWTNRTPTPDRYAALVRQPAATVWRVELASWSGWLAASGQSAQTIKTRTYQLRRLAVTCQDWGPWELTFDDLVAYLGSLGCGPNALRVARQSIRAFYRWGFATGRVRADPSAELPAVRDRRPVPRPAPEEAVIRALAVAEPRTRLAVELGAVTGLRRAEIARAHTRDVVRYPDGWSLRVLGKGGEIREIPLPPELGGRLAEQPAGWLFPSGRGGHLQSNSMGKLMRKALPAGWTPHTLRHRFASRAYTAERDILAVRDLLGHANVRTTQIYTAVPDGAKRAAVTAAATLAV